MELDSFLNDREDLVRVVLSSIGLSYNEAVLQMRAEHRGPVSLQERHDKDPSLLKGHMNQAKAYNLQLNL